MLERELDELKLTGSLPSPTGVGLALLKLTEGDDYALDDITRMIQSDPALTGRIIKLANLSAHGGQETISTAAEAAMRLGVNSVRNLALGFTLVSGNRSGSCRGFDYRRYWSNSLAMAVCGQVLADQLKGCPASDAFTCGLLSDIGSLALASIHPERYADLLEASRRAGSSRLTDLEREDLDLDHRELCGAMLRDWKLPESFAFAVENYEDSVIEDAPSKTAEKMTYLLQLSRRLLNVGVLRDDWDGASADEKLSSLRQELGLDAQEFARLGTAVRDGNRDWGKLLRIPGGGGEDVGLSSDSDCAPGAPAKQHKGLRILAVDDDPVSLRLLEHHLLRDGHEVVKATDGKQALELALKVNPQMVVTDWMMPEMTGIDLCKALRRTKEGQAMYVLLLTGREDEDRVVEGFTAGADEYVVKPFNPKILLARVGAGQRMIEMREQSELDRQQRERQVAEMAVLNRKLKAAALTDVLTRLPNRRYAMRRLEEDLATAVRSGQDLTLIGIDIDNFKLVNDQFGHDMGDRVLQETAAVLRRETRKGDVVCRLGGEEFLVVCSDCNREVGHATAERIREAIEEHVIGGGFGRSVTISLGVASLHEGPATVDELLKSSDERVYLSKNAGRNRVTSTDIVEEGRRTA